MSASEKKVDCYNKTRRILISDAVVVWVENACEMLSESDETKNSAVFQRRWRRTLIFAREKKIIPLIAHTRKIYEYRGCKKISAKSANQTSLLSVKGVSSLTIKSFFIAPTMTSHGVF